MNSEQPQTPWDLARRGIWPAVGLALFLYLMLLGFETAVRMQQTATVGPEIRRTITVDAQGKVTATPDTARFVLAVLTEGKTVGEVVAEGTQKMNAIIAEVKALGVPAQDIATTGYNLYPKYSQVPLKPGEPEELPSPVNPFSLPPTVSKIAGYTLNQDLTVKVRDISQVGKILERATALGANQTGGISFIIDDPEPLKAKARAEAFKNLAVKANTIASQAGVRLGRIVNVSEYGAVPGPYQTYFREGIGGGGGGTPPTIEPGSQEVAVSVTVTYEIRER